MVGVDKDSKDRLDAIEALLDRRMRQGSVISWIKRNPRAAYGYDIDDADEDVRWMIFEIRRLRTENSELQAFVDAMRAELGNQLDGK